MKRIVKIAFVWLSLVIATYACMYIVRFFVIGPPGPVPYKNVKATSKNFKIVQIKAFRLPRGYTIISPVCHGVNLGDKCLCYIRFYGPEGEPGDEVRPGILTGGAREEHPYHFPKSFQKIDMPLFEKNKSVKISCSKDREKYLVSTEQGIELAVIDLPTQFPGQCLGHDISLNLNKAGHYLISFEPDPQGWLMERLVYGFVELAPK